MGMGNDGIEVSNSLDSCAPFNNSRIRDVNSAQNTDNMQSKCVRRNADEDRKADSAASEVQGKDPNDIENMNIGYETSVLIEESQSVSDVETSTTCTEKQEELNDDEPYEGKTIESDCSDDKDKGDAKLSPSSGNNSECQDEIIKGEMASADMEPIPATTYRNNSLLQVSYLKRAWGGKRVTAIRSVSELLEIFYSLEEPIITPIPRERDYYDQWARLPCCDVIQRLYPRANSSVSMKRWALFQSIQNEQAKSSAAASPVLSPQKLTPPSNGEAICKSLDSIIDHYNQMLHNPPTEIHPKISPPVTPLKNRPVSHQTQSHSGSTRGSSCHNSRGFQPSKEEVVTLKTPTSRTKILPSTPKKVKGEGFSTNPVMSSKKGDISRKDSRTKKCPFPDYELNADDTLNPSMTNVEIVDTSRNSPNDIPPGPVIPQNPGQTESSCHPDPISKGKVNISVNAGKDVSPDHGSLYFEKTLSDSGGRDSRNPYDMNTNTLSFSLPHERSPTSNDIQRNPPSPSTKFQMSPAIVDGSPETKNVSEKHERFPLRSTAFVSRGKRTKTTLEYSYNRITRLKNISRSIATPTQNIQDLRESLLIHEVNCDSDNKAERPKWDQTLKNSNSLKPKGKQPLRHHECRQMAPQLPSRMHTMLERLSSERPALDQLSPRIHTPQSRENSAVSLASVHFLDLADLKSFLKKSNTTLHHL